MIASSLVATTLWRESLLIPNVLETTIERVIADEGTARFLSRPGVRRIVATGNGAAYYVALSFQLAALLRPTGSVDVVAVPAGLLATGHFAWQGGDVMLAISSSGEMADVIAVLERDEPGRFAAVTASPQSTIGTLASARSVVDVASQDSPTHTQAYVGNVAACLVLWAQLSADQVMLTQLKALPAILDGALNAAPEWAAEQVEASPLHAATVFGSGPAWPAALETALLLKEVAGIAAEGMETREGATSGMYALDERSLAISVAASNSDPAVAAAEHVCENRGATVVSLRAPEADLRMVAATAFPSAVALAGQLGLNRGLDIDHPAWLESYFTSARRDATTEPPAGRPFRGGSAGSDRDRS